VNIEKERGCKAQGETLFTWTWPSHLRNILKVLLETCQPYHLFP
jgi:hypothetical protein